MSTFTLVQFFKVYQLLLITSKILLPVCSVYQEIDPVFLSFPQYFNFSKGIAQKYYLPPESPTFGLPEVIDNRVRVPVNSPNVLSFTPRPATKLQAPFANSEFYTTYTVPQSNSHQQARIPIKNDSFADTSFFQISTNEMSCQNNGEELYFRASFSPMKRTGHPAIENAGSKSCKITQYNSEYRIDFGKDDFWNCGVIDCSAESGKFYCLNLRFPMISGLKLKDDFKVTLQCRAQETIASHVRRINLKTIDTNARMAPQVATGGYKSALETEIALYRKIFGSEQVFDAKIEPGETVVLGEEILLRAAVREGDGWKYSKISEVSVHFVERQQRRKVMNSLWILDSEGCLNPQIEEICSGEQYRIGPLESYLLFKAFMFENMQETEEMVLSVKVTGCLRSEDCALNCSMSHRRKTRSVTVENKNDTFNWQNDITFKVVSSVDKIESTSSNLQTVLPSAVFVLILTIILLVICIIKFFTVKRKQTEFYK